ncbi:MAG: ferrous iron transport protein A [Chloroflexaceae bacterium]|jgi:ferrous iron transport protein A|nr:ferrous iron transport protein A [Chloroflexaceae bacterium]
MQPTHKSTLPLALVGVGQQVRLVHIAAHARLAHRLTELGLAPGVALEIAQDAGSNLILAVGDTRLALSRGTAHTIHVALEPL